MTASKTLCWRTGGAIAAAVAVASLVLPAWGAIFTDIQGLPAQRAIERLAAKGIFRIGGDGKFNPGAPVLRAEMAFLIARALNLSGQGVALPNFKDAGEIPLEMRPAVAAMVHLSTVSSAKVEQRKSALVYTLTTDKTVYGPTEQVELTFTITNTGKEDVQFEFANSQFHDFITKDSDGTEVARWSIGRAFLPVDKPVTLATGQKFEYKTRWRQLDQNDQPVPPGRYEIIAVQTTKTNPTSLSLFLNKGLFTAFPDDTFRPKLEVNRADLAVLAVRALGWEESRATPQVADLAEIPVAARGAVATAIEKRLVVPGSDRFFRPTRAASRADVAGALDVLMEILKRYDFSRGTLKDIRIGAPTLITIEEANKAQRTFRVARANAVYRNNAPSDLRNLKAGDDLLFLKAGDVGDVTYIEATGR